MQLDRHTSELGQWQAVQRAADSRLRPYVHGYLGSSSRIPTPIRERHLPSTEVRLLLNFGAPHRRLETRGGDHASALDGAWVVGLHDRPQLSEAIGERRFMVVRFTPIGAYEFFRLPMHLIAGHALKLEDLDPVFAAEVLNRAGSAADWSERFAAVEELIAERVTRGAAPPALAWAWNKLQSTGGRIPLGRLVSEVECSHRRMIEQFRICVGQPPKTVARLLRFNRAVLLLNRRAHPGSEEPASKPYIESLRSSHTRSERIEWAGLAADSGYFDQAHFIKEFRRFAESTPTRFLRTMFRTG